jgi:hypothetical protein
MAHSDPSGGAERQADNPYAPPQAEIGPQVDERETVAGANQLARQPTREIAFRLGGLLGFILAIVVILAFGYGILARVRDANDFGGRGIELGMPQTWIVLASVISLSTIATATSWGMFRLQNWARWALTIAATLSVPTLFCVGFLAHQTVKPGFRENFNYNAFTVFCVMSLLSCLMLLFLMWSPIRRTVFSPGYRNLARQMPNVRQGCFGLILAVIVVLAGSMSYFALLLSLLTILESIN